MFLVDTVGIYHWISLPIFLDMMYGLQYKRLGKLIMFSAFLMFFNRRQQWVKIWNTMDIGWIQRLIYSFSVYINLSS
jgi:hypothetical protein